MNRLLTVSALTTLAGMMGAAEHPAEHPDDHLAGPHGHSRHHAGFFIGGVSRFEHGHRETGGAVGIEYEYRLAPRWGLGVLAERVAVGDGRELAAVVPLSWHPWRGLRLSVGPGVEFHDGSGEFLGRVAAGYDFHLGHFTLSPEVAGDFTRVAQSVVYGLTIGYGF